MSLRSIARSLGFDRPELRAWAMYDWANSAFFTVVVTAVFPPYFQAVASNGVPGPQATSRFAMATAISMAIIAVVSPLVGAFIDTTPQKKKFLGLGMALGASSCAALALAGSGDWLLAATFFILANVGAGVSMVCYDSLLPHLAKPHEIDRVSSAGYAFGYIGGGVLLALDLVLILKPQWFGIPDSTTATRIAFVTVGVWWAAFSWPLFRHVPEPAIVDRAVPSGAGNVIGSAFRNLWATFQELRRYRQAMLMLVAFLIYNDGIQTIFRFATVFGKEIGIDQGAMIGAILLVQFIGIPCTFLFGPIAARLGPKRTLYITLVVYALVSVIGYRMQTARDFFTLAILVGFVQGAAQALSRSLYASLIPAHKAGEFFGFYAVSEKSSAILGPLAFSLAISATGSSRPAILAIIAFFVVGGLVLSRVDVAAGRRAAAEALPGRTVA